MEYRIPQKAIEVLENGTNAQRIDLYIAECDKRAHNRHNDYLKPLLGDEDLQKLLDRIDHKDWHKLQSKIDRYNTISAAIKEISRSFEVIMKQRNMLAYWQHNWAMIEQMETAVNVALLQIPDAEKRTATAMGLAKNMQLFGCSQSVDDEGFLVISPINIAGDTDTASNIKDVSRKLVTNIADYKAAIEATREAIKKYGLTMTASKDFIKKIEDIVKSYDLWEKYSDKSQDPTIGTIDEQLCELYKPYYIMPIYANIPANEETKKMFRENFLKIKD